MSFAGDKISRLARRAENAYYQRDREEILLVCKTYDEEIAALRAKVQSLQTLLDLMHPSSEE